MAYLIYWYLSRVQTFAGITFREQLRLRGDKISRVRKILAKFRDFHANFDHFSAFLINISQVIAKVYKSYKLQLGRRKLPTSVIRDFFLGAIKCRSRVRTFLDIISWYICFFFQIEISKPLGLIF